MNENPDSARSLLSPLVNHWIPAEDITDAGYYWWVDWPPYAGDPLDHPRPVFVIVHDGVPWMTPPGKERRRVVTHGGFLFPMAAPDVPRLRG